MTKWPEPTEEHKKGLEALSKLGTITSMSFKQSCEVFKKKSNENK